MFLVFIGATVVFDVFVQLNNAICITAFFLFFFGIFIFYFAECIYRFEFNENIVRFDRKRQLVHFYAPEAYGHGNKFISIQWKRLTAAYSRRILMNGSDNYISPYSYDPIFGTEAAFLEFSPKSLKSGEIRLEKSIVKIMSYHDSDSVLATDNFLHQAIVYTGKHDDLSPGNAIDKSKIILRAIKSFMDGEQVHLKQENFLRKSFTYNWRYLFINKNPCKAPWKKNYKVLTSVAFLLSIFFLPPFLPVVFYKWFKTKNCPHPKKLPIQVDDIDNSLLKNENKTLVKTSLQNNEAFLKILDTALSLFAFAFIGASMLVGFFCGFRSAFFLFKEPDFHFALILISVYLAFSVCAHFIALLSAPIMRKISPDCEAWRSA
jgi:hypothetical protein